MEFIGKIITCASTIVENVNEREKGETSKKGKHTISYYQKHAHKYKAKYSQARNTMQNTRKPTKSAIRHVTSQSDHGSPDDEKSTPSLPGESDTSMSEHESELSPPSSSSDDEVLDVSAVSGRHKKH